VIAIEKGCLLSLLVWLMHILLTHFFTMIRLQITLRPVSITEEVPQNHPSLVSKSYSEIQEVKKL